MKKVVDIPNNLLILLSKYIGDDKYYSNFSEAARDGMRMALSKAKRSGMDRIGTKEFLER